METLTLNSTESTPEITLDKANNVLKIIGRSFPEDSMSFYKPVLGWLQEYAENPNDPTTLEIKLDYFNSGSLKQIFKMLYVIEDIMELGKDAKVLWHYNKSDELMRQKGLEFQKFLDVKVVLQEH